MVLDGFHDGKNILRIILIALVILNIIGNPQVVLKRQ